MSGVAVLTLVHTAIGHALAPTRPEPPFGITQRSAILSPRPSV